MGEDQEHPSRGAPDPGPLDGPEALSLEQVRPQDHQDRRGDGEEDHVGGGGEGYSRVADTGGDGDSADTKEQEHAEIPGGGKRERPFADGQKHQEERGQRAPQGDERQRGHLPDGHLVQGRVAPPDGDHEDQQKIGPDSGMPRGSECVHRFSPSQRDALV
jgi:hypothetical protein